MKTVKLCTYTRGFYPTVWSYRMFTVIGIYLIIVDGKIIKRSFSELGYTKAGEFGGEFDALNAGLEWIVKNIKDPRKTTVQVFFCGSHRAECKRIVDSKDPIPAGGMIGRNGEIIQYGIENLIKKFNKVEYFTTSRVLTHEGSSKDTAEAVIFSLYDMAHTIFELLYGDSDIKHDVLVDEAVDGFTRKILVGQPEIRWSDGTPKSMRKWS
jgi:hypothetical protein